MSDKMLTACLIVLITAVAFNILITIVDFCQFT